MAIDKNKIIEAATKYVQKGQYDKAIKEYNKLLEADPRDARIQQKLGELYQKKGDNNLAADCFLKVAESYAGDGFFLKAVAVYKQVLKLNPNLIDVNLRLAELHQQLGLMSDAMAQFQLVVAHYEKTGNTKASLDTLRKMVDLDPDNIASRIKLAELYARESMNPEAISEFQRAAEYLKRNNRVDDYVKVAERLVFLDPGNIELTRELAAIYLAKQDTKRALAKLQLCFKADPKDVETLSMLAQAFKDLGQTSKTVSVYKELAKIYDEQDKVDEERDVWKKILELAPDDPDARAKMAPARPAVIAPPPAAAAPARGAPGAATAPGRAPAAAQAAPGGKLSPEQIAKLLTETDVYVKYGLHEKAIEHLRKVFAADPESVEGHEKAIALYTSTGNNAGALESMVRVIRICIGKGDLERARTNLQLLCEKDPTHPELQGFLEACGGLAPVEEVAEIEEDAILVEATDEDIEVAPEPPQHDFSLDAAAQSLDLHTGDEPVLEVPPDDDDAALNAAAESLAAEAGDELIADSSDDELIAAPPDDDDLAIAAAADLAEDLIDPGADEELLATGQEFTDNVVVPTEDDLLGPAPADELVAAAEEIVEETAAPFGRDEVPFDAPADEFAEPLADAPDLGGYEQESDPHEESTRVVHLPSMFAAESAPAAQPSEPEPQAGQSMFGEEGNEEVTAVLPVFRSSPAQQRQAEPEPEPDAETSFADVQDEPAQQEFEVEPVADEFAEPEPGAGDAAANAGAPDESGYAEPEPETAPESEFADAQTEPEPEPAAEVPAEPEEDPAADELDEAAFFIEQGVLEEAREILETVQLAYPGSARAAELMALLEARERGEVAPPPEEPVPEAAPEAPPEAAPAEDAAFDLASELANEDFGDIGADASTAEDFQYSVEDVFSEFKKGVQKIVKPEDVDTHYDLGIAYKEMGLIEDAIGEFEQARSACEGKKKEVECLTMVGLCRVEREQFAEAIEAFKRGLGAAEVTPEAAKALHFEIGLAEERLGNLPKALQHFARVEKSDPKYRDVKAIADRIRASGVRELAEAEETTEPSGRPGVTARGSNGKATRSAVEQPPTDPTTARKGRNIGYV